ncbi:ung [Symbiodinium natans]|uniref:NAD(P)(+)--arginine ADP-ribosyltransferase n=1 Tax=Symbiodinium natans TaxID=878477 RepID=A0A812Q3C2_9DINO|nr:ung [Symbiodinium natans]
MPISEADALAAHAAIHGDKTSVTLPSGKTLKVVTAKNGCKSIKFPDFQAMEQNKAKSSEWAKKAKAGVKITWFLSGNSPSTWGRVVDGKLDSRGKAIADAADTAKTAVPKKGRPAKEVEKEAAPKAAAKADPKRSAKASPKAKSRSAGSAGSTGTSAATASGSPAKKRSAPPSPPAPPPAAKKAKLKEEVGESLESLDLSEDPLQLAPLFSGMGHGATWMKILKPVLESLSDAPSFIGPSRDKSIIPVRELTFQALKPNLPSGWRVVSLGQSPYPRIESATGIAHFDNAIKSWDSGKFGSVVTMRCIIKAAAMSKFKISKDTKVPDLRKLLKTKGTVGPPEWFQAMLAQGVLLMNAACTIKPVEGGSRAGEVVEEHLLFWQPVMEAVVNAILEDCQRSGRPVIFAWWGTESLKTKKFLDKRSFAKYPDVQVRHIEHKNPAAMGDRFCDAPNVFDSINKAIRELKLGNPIDWLPDETWKAALGIDEHAEEMGAFVAETQELHRMYLERLKDGLDSRADDLEDILGVTSQPLVDLPSTCEPFSKVAAGKASVDRAGKMVRAGLSIDEAAALHLYTTNHLYKALNAALRDPERKKTKQYFLYLRLFLAAMEKLPSSKRQLYRGVALDLQDQYKLGTTVTWWAVSSCTPDLEVASNFCSGGKKSTLFLITASRSVGIRDFSEYKSEEEYILAPGTQFKVTNVERKGSAVKIHMTEMETPRRVQ